MVEASTVANVASSVVLIGLATWLLVLRFNSRAARIFAVVLFFRGLITLFTQVGNEVQASAPARAEMWFNLAVYPALALPFLVGYFAWVYPRPRRGHLGVVVAALTVVAVLEAWFLINHCFVACGDNVGLGILSYPLLTLAYAGAGGLFVREGRQGSDPHFPALRLAGLSLLVSAALDAMFSLKFGFGSGALAAVGTTISVVALSVSVVGVVWIATAGRWLAGFSLTWLAAAVASVLAFEASWAPHGAGLVWAGLVRVSLAAIIVYALVRHCLFDVTVRLRWTVDRSLIAGSFILVFFVVSELMEELVSRRFGLGFGLTAAALLVFVQAPLHRVTYRVARAIVPGSGDLGFDEREALYRDQAILAWEDGLLGPRERRILDHLREQLGIPEDRAEALEAEARGASA